MAVPIDADGLDVDELERPRRPRPKLLYTIPDHQNPAGVSLSAERRGALVELARRDGFLIVEDVAYRELGFDGVGAAEPVEPRRRTWSCRSGRPPRRSSRACGSAGPPGPPEVVAQLVVAKQNTDQCASALGQRLLGAVRAARRDGRAARPLARPVPAAGASCCSARSTGTCPTASRWTRPEGGFFSWLTLPDGVDAVDLARRAAAAGVAIVPGAPFFPDGRGAATSGSRSAGSRTTGSRRASSGSPPSSTTRRAT